MLSLGKIHSVRVTGVNQYSRTGYDRATLLFLSNAPALSLPLLPSPFPSTFLSPSPSLFLLPSVCSAPLSFSVSVLLITTSFSVSFIFDSLLTFLCLDLWTPKVEIIRTLPSSYCEGKLVNIVA